MQTCALCPCLTRNLVCRACNSSALSIRSYEVVECQACRRRVCPDHDNECRSCNDYVSVDDYVSEIDTESIDSETDDDTEVERYRTPSWRRLHFTFESSSRATMIRHLPAWMRDAVRTDRPQDAPVYVPQYLNRDDWVEDPPDRLELEAATRVHPTAPPDRRVMVQLTLCDTCPICLVNFTESEWVTQLPCHSTHMFHTPCIERWKFQCASCPLCKQ